MTGYVDRTMELERSHELFDSVHAELSVVYGRRRLGKTRLVKTALEEFDDAIYYPARQKTKTVQLKQFVEVRGQA